MIEQETRNIKGSDDYKPTVSKKGKGVDHFVSQQGVGIVYYLHRLRQVREWIIL